MGPPQGPKDVSVPLCLLGCCTVWPRRALCEAGGPAAASQEVGTLGTSLTSASAIGSNANGSGCSRDPTVPYTSPSPGHSRSSPQVTLLTVPSLSCRSDFRLFGCWSPLAWTQHCLLLLSPVTRTLQALSHHAFLAVDFFRCCPSQSLPVVMSSACKVPLCRGSQRCPGLPWEQRTIGSEDPAGACGFAVPDIQF